MDSNYRPTVSEESRIIERIRISYIRHRGNIINVCDELPTIPKDYIEKNIQKFRKQSKEDTKRLVADTILEHLLLGHQSRVQHAQETLMEITKVEKQLRSSCCRSEVRKLQVEGVDLQELQYECIKCGEMSDTFGWLNEDALSLKLNTLEVLRKEDEALSKFLEKLGYTEKKETDKPHKTVIKEQHILVMSSSSTQQVDPQLMQDTVLLRPIEQEALRLKLEKQIIEAEVVEEHDQNK